jgi:lysophospholipase L1-like esterase
MQGWVADNNSNVTLYGDIVPSSGYRSEGRYGWSVDDYFANTTKNGQTNTFYNPTTQTFDFSYYMANHPDYNDVTAVNIFLGMNNAFDTSKISLLLQMAESVKAYNSNIIVTIMGAPQLAEDNSGAGRYLQNVHTMNKQFFDYNVAFFGTEVPSGVYFILPSANLDSIYDFETETVDSSIVNNKQVTLYTNNVHPSTAGYKKMGIGLSSFLRNIVS